jgi:hypothetical protein
VLARRVIEGGAQILTKLRPSRQNMLKQEAKETRKNLINAFWLLNFPPLDFSGLHGFVLKL